MDCRTFERMIPYYLKQNIQTDKLAEFINHVRNCPKCYEELEIYYTINNAIKQLDGTGFDRPDLKLYLEEQLETMTVRVRRFTVLRVLRYVMMSISFWCIVFALIYVGMQLLMFFK